MWVWTEVAIWKKWWWYSKLAWRGIQDVSALVGELSERRCACWCVGGSDACKSCFEISAQFHESVNRTNSLWHQDLNRKLLVPWTWTGLHVLGQGIDHSLWLKGALWRCGHLGQVCYAAFKPGRPMVKSGAIWDQVWEGSIQFNSNQFKLYSRHAFGQYRKWLQEISWRTMSTLFLGTHHKPTVWTNS